MLRLGILRVGQEEERGVVLRGGDKGSDGYGPLRGVMALDSRGGA